MGVSGLGDTQIYEVAPPAEVAPDGWIVGRGDGPAGSGGSHDDQGAGGARDDAERDRPAAGCDGGGGAASPPAHGSGGGGRAAPWCMDQKKRWRNSPTSSEAYRLRRNAIH